MSKGHKALRVLSITYSLIVGKAFTKHQNISFFMHLKPAREPACQVLSIDCEVHNVRWTSASY